MYENGLEMTFNFNKKSKKKPTKLTKNDYLVGQLLKQVCMCLM